MPSIFCTRLLRISTYINCHPLPSYPLFGLLSWLLAHGSSSPHSIQTQQEAAPTTTIAPTILQPSLASPPSRKVTNIQAPTRGSRPQIRTAKSAEPIDPRLLPSDTHDETAEIEARLNVEHEPGYREALGAWARFRFVRAGWFTKEEAIKYIV